MIAFDTKHVEIKYFLNKYSGKEQGLVVAARAVMIVIIIDIISIHDHCSNELFLRYYYSIFHKLSTSWAYVCHLKGTQFQNN